MNLNFKKIIAAVSALTLVCGMTSVQPFMHPIVIMKGDVAIAEFSVSSLLSQYKAMEDTKEIAAAIEDYCIAAKAYFANEKVENYSNYYAIAPPIKS